MRALITSGAGFIGANMAVGLATRHPDWELIALDNLHRHGAELNLPRLREAGVSFIHGDVRMLHDLLDVGEIGALLECSAEPSALAGSDGPTDCVVKSNLLGAYNCLELARRYAEAQPLAPPAWPARDPRRHRRMDRRAREHSEGCPLVMATRRTDSR